MRKIILLFVSVSVFLFSCTNPISTVDVAENDIHNSRTLVYESDYGVEWAQMKYKTFFLGDEYRTPTGGLKRSWILALYGRDVDLVGPFNTIHLFFINGNFDYWLNNYKNKINAGYKMNDERIVYPNSNYQRLKFDDTQIVLADETNTNINVPVDNYWQATSDSIAHTFGNNEHYLSIRGGYLNNFSTADIIYEGSIFEATLSYNEILYDQQKNSHRYVNTYYFVAPDYPFVPASKDLHSPQLSVNKVNPDIIKGTANDLDSNGTPLEIYVDEVLKYSNVVSGDFQIDTTGWYPDLSRLYSVKIIANNVCENGQIPVPSAYYNDKEVFTETYNWGWSWRRWEQNRYPNYKDQRILLGDFDGDKITDVAKVFNDGGMTSINVYLCTGNSFKQEARWETRAGAFWDTQKWIVGDFDGDGDDDIANVHNDYGYTSIDVHSSSRTRFTFRRWETRAGGFWNTQQWMAGDFDGDGDDDLANVHNDHGYTSIDVHSSDKTRFTFRRWETRAGAFWDTQKWIVGDFDGDGDDDLGNIHNDHGYTSIDVHSSDKTKFTFKRWETKAGAFWDTQRWLSGDFDLKRGIDLMNVFGNPGTAFMDLHKSTTTAFNFKRLRDEVGGFWPSQFWGAGDFTGDGVTDVVSVFTENGKLAIDVHTNLTKK